MTTSGFPSISLTASFVKRGTCSTVVGIAGYPARAMSRRSATRDEMTMDLRFMSSTSPAVLHAGQMDPKKLPLTYTFSGVAANAFLTGGRKKRPGSPAARIKASMARVGTETPSRALSRDVYAGDVFVTFHTRRPQG